MIASTGYNMPFLNDNAKDKRQKLVDRLLSDDKYVEQYAQYWAGVWANVLIGRTTADLVRNVLIIVLMIIVGYIIGFRFQAGAAQALACIALVSAFGLALSWIFAFVALTVRGAEAAQTAGFVVLFPLVFASSVFVPVSTLPNWLQAVAKVSPVTLAANAARSLALVPGTPSSLGGAIAWIAGLLAVFIPLSVWRYRRMT